MHISKIIISVILAMPLLTVGVVATAETDTATTTSKTTTQEKTTLTAEQKAEALKKMQSRLEERKKQFKTKLQAAEKVRIQKNCKNSQGKLRSLDGRIKGIETSREKVYTNLVDRLTKTQTKLQEKGIDTTTLSGNIETLKGMIGMYANDLLVYKQTVSDLAAMECAADPDSFKASLEAARTALQKVQKDTKDIREYVGQTIKPTLKQIRANVEKKQKSSEGSQQ